MHIGLICGYMGSGVAEVLSCKGKTQKQRVTPSVNSGPAGHCYFAVKMGNAC